MPIQNDAEWEATVARIVKATEFISNPLTDAKDKERYLVKYDELVEEVRAYIRIECHGYDYLKEGIRTPLSDAQKATQKPLFDFTQPSTQAATESPKTEPQKPRMSAFLDDDE